MGTFCLAIACWAGRGLGTIPEFTRRYGVDILPRWSWVISGDILLWCCPDPDSIYGALDLANGDIPGDIRGLLTLYKTANLLNYLSIFCNIFTLPHGFG